MKKVFSIFVVAVLVFAAVCSCLTASAASTNVAKGKKYEISAQFRQNDQWQYDENADVTYPDDGVKLTDGKLPADDATYSDGAWMAFHGGTPQYKDELHYSYVRVDLEKVYDLTELRLYVGTSALGSGIGIPTSVQFFVSEDGKTFTEVSEEIAPTDSTEVTYTAVTAEVEVSARYVEARIKRDGNWMFITEIEAYADVEGSGNTEDSKTEETPSKAEPANPGTGDYTMAFALVAIVAVAGAVVVAKKRAR